MDRVTHYVGLPPCPHLPVPPVPTCPAGLSLCVYLG